MVWRSNLKKALHTLKKDNLLFKNESTFIALGFGSGLAKFAPGTF